MIDPATSTAVQLGVMAAHIDELRRAIEAMDRKIEAKRTPWWQWVATFIGITMLIGSPVVYYSQAIEQLRSDVRTASVERGVLRRDVDGLISREAARQEAARQEVLMAKERGQ